MFGRCPDTRPNWNVLSKTRQVWLPRKESGSGGVRRRACADHSGLPGGQADSAGAREHRLSVATVSKWHRRFALWGLRGLRDQLRPGKPVRYDAAFRNRVLATLEEPPPPGTSHWDGPA